MPAPPELKKFDPLTSGFTFATEKDPPLSVMVSVLTPATAEIGEELAEAALLIS